MSGGVRYVFTGSWCSPGRETSWNGSWRLSGSGGSATWDGDHAPEFEAEADAAPAASVDPGVEIAGSLAAFAAALRTGEPVMGEVHENVLSLVMVEAAVESAASGTRVRVDDVLERAYARAVADERRDDVRARLESWTSVRAALTRGARATVS